MTCPGCGCELQTDESNPQELTCEVCGWSGHPVECYQDSPDDDEQQTA